MRKRVQPAYQPRRRKSVGPPPGPPARFCSASQPQGYGVNITAWQLQVAQTADHKKGQCVDPGGGSCRHPAGVNGLSDPLTCQGLFPAGATLAFASTTGIGRCSPRHWPTKALEGPRMRGEVAGKLDTGTLPWGARAGYAVWAGRAGVASLHGQQIGRCKPQNPQNPTFFVLQVVAQATSLLPEKLRP